MSLRVFIALQLTCLAIFAAVIAMLVSQGMFGAAALVALVTFGCMFLAVSAAMTN